MLVISSFRLLTSLLSKTERMCSQNSHSSKKWVATLALNQFQTFSNNIKVNFCTTKNVQLPDAKQSTSPQLHNQRITKIQYQSINNQNLSDSLELVSRNFAQFQPLRNAFFKKYPTGIAQRINFQRKIYRDYEQQLIENDLSTIACQKDQFGANKVVSALIVKDYAFSAANFSQNVAQLNVFSAINAIYDQTKKAQGSQFDYVKSLAERGMVAHFWLGATSLELSRSRIFSNLMLQCQRKAKVKGYKYILLWSTNTKTRNISKKMNYLTLSVVDTKKIKVFGQHPFSYSCEESRFSYLFMKPIQ